MQQIKQLGVSQANVGIVVGPRCKGQNVHGPTHGRGLLGHAAAKAMHTCIKPFNILISRQKVLLGKIVTLQFARNRGLVDPERLGNAGLAAIPVTGPTEQVALHGFKRLLQRNRLRPVQVIRQTPLR